MSKTVEDRLAVFRSDGFMNAITGIGKALYDKAQNANYVPECRRTIVEDEALWRGDDMAAKVVEKPVFEMLRAGFSVVIKNEEAPNKATTRTDAFPVGGMAPPSLPPVKPQLPSSVDPIKKAVQSVKAQRESKAITDKLMHKLKKLKVRERFTEALHYDRAIGGAGIYIGVDDGQKSDQPLRRDADGKLLGVKALKFLTPLHRSWMQPYALQGDPTQDDFGEISLWRVQVPHFGYNYQTAPGAAQPPLPSEIIIHSSRLLMWQGIQTSLNQILENGGFGDSIFMRLYRPLRDLQQSKQGAAILMQDFAQAVIKIKGLADMLMTDQDDLIKLRFQMIDLSRSIAKCVVLDADEDFERKSTSLAGYADMMDRFAMWFAGSADMPATVIFGKAPDGQNATGDGDDRNWKDACAALQVVYVEPNICKLLEIEFAAESGVTEGKPPETWAVKWNPLHRPTEKESADARYVQAQTDQIYWNIQVMSEDDIATSAFGGPDYSFDRQIDFEARAAIAKAQAEMPPPVAPPVMPPTGGKPAPTTIPNGGK